MADVDYCGHEHRHRERDDDRQDPERSRWPPRDVEKSDGHRDTKGAEMACIVDRGGSLAEQQIGDGQHELGGRHGGERESYPLATADGRWVRTSEHTRGQIGDGLGETHTQDPVHLTDLGPPRLALRASSEVGIGCGIFFLD